MGGKSALYDIYISIVIGVDSGKKRLALKCPIF